MDILLLAVAYAGCLFYAGLNSVIDYGGARYFVPLLPLLLLLLGLALQTMLTAVPQEGTARRILTLALAVSMSLYAFLNLQVFRAPERAGWLPIAALLDATTSDGKSARAVVQDLTGSNGVVMANNGQTIGHLLERPTVSLVGPHFSTLEWNERAILAAVRRFKAKAIVIYGPVTPEQWDNDDIVPSSFVRGLAQGNAPPWLQLVYRTGNLFVYVPHLEDS